MRTIKNIELTHFRNLKKLNLSFNERVNLIIGQNGQGKTSILEAISLLVSGQSFRQGKYVNYIHFDESYARINLHMFDEISNYAIEYRFFNNKKEFYFNQKKHSASKVFQKLNYVLFSPESLSVIKDGPEQRRNLIDCILASFSVTNHKIIKDFKQCLKNRNKILRDIRTEKVSKDQGMTVLASLDEIYLGLSTELCVLRIEILNKLKPYIVNSLSFILGSGENVDISVDYVISSKISNHLSKQEILQGLKARRNELLNAEMAMGTSLIGPHKHDIKFLFNDNDSRYFCSQGQQRAYILAIKMAQIVYYHDLIKKYPILLLDDVMSELDETKRQNLLQFLKQIKAQIFITTTDFDLQNSIDHSNLSVYELKSGNNSGLIQTHL